MPVSTTVLRKDSFLTHPSHCKQVLINKQGFTVTCDQTKCLTNFTQIERMSF